jgi:hypothetical protein
VKSGFFFGQVGGIEWGIGVSAWSERTYADTPRRVLKGKLFVFTHFFSFRYRFGRRTGLFGQRMERKSCHSTVIACGLNRLTTPIGLAHFLAIFRVKTVYLPKWAHEADAPFSAEALLGLLGILMNPG